MPRSKPWLTNHMHKREQRLNKGMRFSGRNGRTKAAQVEFITRVLLEELLPVAEPELTRGAQSSQEKIKLHTLQQ